MPDPDPPLRPFPLAAAQDYANLALTLRTLRTAHGLTQQRLAERSGSPSRRSAASKEARSSPGIRGSAFYCGPWARDWRSRTGAYG
jgi:hypothetical protein